MFDQQPSTPQTTAPAPANIPTGARPAVDDMFAQTDPMANQPTAYAPQTQTSYQPSQMMSSLPPNQEMFGGRSFPIRTAIIVIVALALLGSVGFGAWWVITSQFNSVVPTSKNPTPIDTPTNNNASLAPSTTTTTTQPAATTTTQVQPVFVDTDSDGLSDDQERQLGTDPDRADTDIDGLIDRAEIQVYKTDPLKADTDGDSYEDGAEVINGYDPLLGGGAKLNQAVLPTN